MRLELRYALRALRRSPGFTIATIVTLALGIGANSAMFSVVDAVLLKPLAYRNPQQLMVVYSTAADGTRNFVSDADLEDWRTSSQSFSALSALVPQSVNLTGRGEPERVIGSFVAANWFEMLEVRPALGRLFVAGEDKPGATLTAVLTDRVWHTHFGADSGIVGQKVLFQGEPYTVIGVLRPDFIDAPWDDDVFLPAFKYPHYSRDRAYANTGVVGRLRAGVSLAQAQAEMNAIAARLAAEYPKTNRGRGALVVPLKEIVVGDLRPAVLALLGAVGFVLLIACANVAGLFAARIVARERERSIRLALGANRARLITQVLTEALVVTIAGGAAGLMLAWWSMAAIARAMAGQLPAGVHVGLNATVLMCTAGLVAISTILVAAIPAWQSRAAQWREGMRAGSGAARNRTRAALAAAEIAMAMILLTGAALTLKSLAELNRAQLGFDPHHLLTFEYRVPAAKYPTAGAQTVFHNQVIDQIRTIPGVIAATSVRAVPLGGNGESDEFFVMDRPHPAVLPRALFNAVDPYFFSTMRIPLIRGRVFTEHDSAEAPRVVVINQTLATRFFADRDPVGQFLQIPSQNLTAQVIGVAGDVKQFTPEDEPAPQIWGALPQNPFLFTSVAVRAAGDPSSLMNEIRRAVWRVDKDQPMWRMRTMNATLDLRASSRRLVTSLLGLYAGLALLLAAIGIFGVISYSVGQRRSEIGIRMALGARPREIAAMIFKQGGVMTLIGIAGGLLGAAALARALRAQLYAVSPFDPMVYAMVAAVLGAIALAAAFIPARRAMRVDPIEALRHD